MQDLCGAEGNAIMSNNKDKKGLEEGGDWKG